MPIPYYIKYIEINKYDMLNIEIESIEIIQYQSLPFNSKVMNTLVLDDAKLISLLEDELGAKRIKLIHPDESNIVVRINLNSGKVINSYLSENLIGYNYGSFWLDVSNFEEKLLMDKNE